MSGAIRLTQAASLVVEETGVDPNADTRRVRDGCLTEASLLAECLEGAEADRVTGWQEYVATVVRAASRNQCIDITRVQS